MSESGAFKVFVALHVLDYASAHMLGFSNLVTSTGKNVDKLNAKLKLMGGLAGMMIGGIAVGAVTKLGKEAVHAAVELENVERKLKSIGGVTPDVFKSVSKQGWALGDKFTWTTQEERLGIWGDLHTVFGDAKQANRLWEQALQFRSAMGAVNPETGEQQFFAAFKAAELSVPGRNGHVMNPEEFTKRLGVFSNIYAGSMGRVAPQDMYGFMKQAKYMRYNLTDDALYRAGALMYEQGGSVTGSAYQALARVLGGKLGNSSAGQKYATEFERFGLLENITERSKSGAPTRFNVVGRDLGYRDPNAWAEQVLLPAMQKKGYSLNNQGPFLEQLTRLFGNQTAGNAVFTMLQQQGILHKDAAIFKSSANMDKLQEYWGASGAGNIVALQASWKDLMAAVGQDLVPFVIPVLKTLTGAIRGLGNATREHKGSGALALGGLGLGGGVLFAGGLAQVLSFLLKPIGQLLGKTGMGKGLAAIGPGISRFFGGFFGWLARLGGMAWGGLLAGVTALSGLIGLPVWATVAVFAGIISGAVTIIANWTPLMFKARELWADLMIKVTQGLTTLIMKLRELFQVISNFDVGAAISGWMGGGGGPRGSNYRDPNPGRVPTQPYRPHATPTGPAMLY